MTNSSLGELKSPILRWVRTQWRRAPEPFRHRVGHLIGVVLNEPRHFMVRRAMRLRQRQMLLEQQRKARLRQAEIIAQRRQAEVRLADRKTALQVGGHLAGTTLGSVVVSGYFSEVLGIGRAGRLTADALEAAGLDVLRHDLRPLHSLPPLNDQPLPGGEGGVWIAHCNAPEALFALERLNLDHVLSRYRIGYWAWELPRAPKAWIRAARLFDEIWTPSQFTADSLAGCGKPVRVMPHPLPDLGHIQPDLARFGYRPDRVNFLAMADLRSSAARKNPLGAVKAFMKAFPSAQHTAMLTIKLVQTGADRNALELLEKLAAGRPDVRLLVAEYGGEDILKLMAGADVVLSLHRAEGFGLVPAEAMALGRAVLATGWSGNMTFMAEMPEALIPYRLTTAQDTSGRYRGQKWADPDLEEVARMIVGLTQDVERRQALGRRGQQAVAALRRSWTPQALASQPLAAWLNNPPRKVGTDPSTSL